jgi:hypothetical protein
MPSWVQPFPVVDESLWMDIKHRQRRVEQVDYTPSPRRNSSWCDEKQLSINERPPPRNVMMIELKLHQLLQQLLLYLPQWLFQRQPELVQQHHWCHLFFTTKLCCQILELKKTQDKCYGLTSHYCYSSKSFRRSPIPWLELRGFGCVQRTRFSSFEISRVRLNK